MLEQAFSEGCNQFDQVPRWGVQIFPPTLRNFGHKRIGRHRSPGCRTKRVRAGLIQPGAQDSSLLGSCIASEL